MKRICLPALGAACAAAGLTVALTAQQTFDQSLLKPLAWRNVGPAGAGGRIVDIAAGGENPQRIFAATASGGLFRTGNNGVTWEPVFEHETTVSIGDVAVAPSNADVIWVGTGEANPRNSVSWGDGVYKSSDGGRTWTNMGLKDSRHIGRIQIDPRNADTVYVAALGHTWGPSKERGVFKTADGGLTWTNTLFVNDDTGFVDLAMDPADSRTLYAAAYQRRRDGFAGGDPAIGWGPGSGIYKTTDGARTWRKLSAGLPSGDLGRIGLDVSASNPNIVYAIVQTATTVPREGGGTEEGAGPQAAASPRTMRDGGVFRSDDKGESWQWVNAQNPRPFYYSQVRVDPTDENHVFVLGNNISISSDGGRTFRNDPMNIHVDHHALWIDPRNPKHLVDGNDGGIYMSWDGGKSWDFQNQIAISQFYSVDVDMRRPYYIYGGVQDYCSWGGPSATRNSVGIQTSDWFKVQTGDGFQARVDPTDHTIVYAESQNGGLVRHDLKTGRNTGIRPRPKAGEPPYRFNWESPIFISPHDPKTIYFGGNFVFRSTNRGDAWTAISPELTTEKVGTVTTIGESPTKPGLLYAGTDDGNVWMTRDGANWKNITSRFPGMPGRRWVSRVVASRFAEGTAYVAFDGHRSDDYATYLFRTTDYGDSWKSIVSDLPKNGPVRVVREDVKNRTLLFAGTEFGAFASLDGGGHWLRLMNRMPTVAVADLIVHPRDGDLVAATHGRSFYVMDISPLQELTSAVLTENVHLFTVKPSIAFDYRVFSDDQFLAEKRFVAENPPFGAAITYYLKTAASAAPRITILDKSGKTIRELTGSSDAGLNRVQWDLRYGALPQSASPVGGRGGRGGGAAAAAPQGAPPAGGGGGGRGGATPGPMVEPGEYVARLGVGTEQRTTPIVVEPDPLLETTDETRKLRWSTIETAMNLQRSLAREQGTADSLADQLAGLTRSLATMASVPAAIATSASTAAKKADEVRAALNRASGRVLAVYRDVTGSPFAPTEMSRRELEELAKEIETQTAALNTLTATTIPALESDMNKANLPRITVRRPGSD